MTQDRKAVKSTAKKQAELENVTTGRDVHKYCMNR